MHVFVTGATGWVGSAVVKELIGAGHQVTGLSRSEAKAGALAAAGATVLLGTLDDLDVLRHAASAADAVIHTAFNHDFSKMAENSAQDFRAIETLGAALEGSDRPLLVTSGVALLAPGRLATEADLPPSTKSWPRKSEVAALALAARGVRVATVRLAPSVHGAGDHGFIPILIGLAREKGVSAYVGEGLNRWPGVYRLDAARLYRLALEQGATEPVYHAIADEGVAFKDIAAVIGRRLGIPVESRGPEHFGWFGGFAGADMPASSAHTQSVLGWEPTGPDLLRDIDQAAYFTV
jgi:nucleoside-diphosphate-sugar epimerase